MTTIFVLMVDPRLILRDFTQVKNLSLRQLNELISDIDEIIDKVSQQLPLMLDSFTEVAQDKSGKTKQAKSVLKGYIKEFCASIHDSFAYCFFVEALKNNWRDRQQSSDSPAGFNHLYDMAGTETFDILRCRWDFLGCCAYPFNLPWQAYEFPFYRWPGSNRIPHAVSNMSSYGSITEFLGGSIHILHEDIQSVSLDQGISLEEDIGTITFNYFSNTVLAAILRLMLRDRHSRQTIRLFLADLLSQALSTALGVVRDSDESVATTMDPILLDNSSVNTYLEELDCLQTVQLLKNSAIENKLLLKQLAPAEEFTEWKTLKSKVEELWCCLVELVHDKSSQITIYLGDETEILFHDIYEFLKSNKLNALSIPTISELGKYKGGFALVKSISMSGGLKSIRPLYVAWITQRLRDQPPNDKSRSETKHSN